MQPVLILGAGINGAALARELVLSGVPVWLVDQRDIASGASSRSSHLIHGGLRYLEYGEFELVQESVSERQRLLRLAPQFVRPLELFIPVKERVAGFGAAALKFLGLKRSAKSPPRGLWLVRMGLWMYYKYARDRSLPPPRTLSARDPAAIPVNPQRYRWECSYYDAMVEFPERFILSLLTDAQQEAQRQGIEFKLWTYHQAKRVGAQVQVGPAKEDVFEDAIEPSAIINCTGARVDDTLAALDIPHKRLMGGTKGSHLHTSQPELMKKLAGRGLYAEAADGRPVFILPWADGVLIGTTDLPFEGHPGDVIAHANEISYLIETVNEVMGPGSLSLADVDWHFCGVRPLPYADPRNPAAISRRHWMERHAEAPLPMFSIIGGKLTTCRSLAEESAKTILQALERPVVSTSAERPLPGGKDYPANAEAAQQAQRQLAAAQGLELKSIAAIWRLVGNRAGVILQAMLAEDARSEDREVVLGTALPVAFVRWIVRHEWVETLDDLVCRRLMLIAQRRLSMATLHQLAQILVQEGKLPPEQTAVAVEHAAATLARVYGKRVTPAEG